MEEMMHAGEYIGMMMTAAPKRTKRHYRQNHMCYSLLVVCLILASQTCTILRQSAAGCCCSDKSFANLTVWYSCKEKEMQTSDGRLNTNAEGGMNRLFNQLRTSSK
jgi:uncharacterized protein YecT (DUF1311 family)